MTAPDKIWATEDAENFGEDKFHTTHGPMKGLTEYTRTDLTQAAVAAAYEAAAQAIEKEASNIRLGRAVAYRMEDDAAKETAALILGSLGRVTSAIRALATPDQTAALAASQDTITLPRAEVEALMEAAQLVSDWDEWALQVGGVCPDRLVNCLGKMRISLATLQERMK